MHTLHWLTADFVGLLFILTGAIPLSRWRKDIPQFVKWGYPSYWPAVTYSLKILAGMLVFVPRVQLVGLLLAAAIALAALVTVLYHREPKLHQVAPTIVIIVCVAVVLLS